MTTVGFLKIVKNAALVIKVIAVVVVVVAEVAVGKSERDQEKETGSL